MSVYKLAAGVGGGKKGDAFCSASLPDDYRCGKSLGPVESIQEHPQQPGKILIGYSRGLVILWALSTRQAEQLFLGKQVAVLPLLYQNISVSQVIFNEHFMLFLRGVVLTLFPLSLCVAAGESGVGTFWKPVCEFS